MGESPWKFESSWPHQTVLQADIISPSGTWPAQSGVVLRALAALKFCTEARDALQARNFANKIAGFSV